LERGRSQREGLRSERYNKKRGKGGKKTQQESLLSKKHAKDEGTGKTGFLKKTFT